MIDIRRQLADLYARRHAPGGEWQTIDDVAPQELVDIIWDDVDAIMEEIIEPLQSELRRLGDEISRVDSLIVHAMEALE